MTCASYKCIFTELLKENKTTNNFMPLDYHTEPLYQWHHVNQNICARNRKYIEGLTRAHSLQKNGRKILWEAQDNSKGHCNTSRLQCKQPFPCALCGGTKCYLWLLWVILTFTLHGSGLMLVERGSLEC